MRNRIFAFVAACAFIFNAVGATFADTKSNNPSQQMNQLVALLPASDGVVTVNMQRLLSEAVPQILSGKPQMLTDITAKIDEIRAKTGLDLRQFEQVALGVSTKQISAQEIDLEPVVLARGKYNAGALIALGKLAANGKYREEKIGERTVYIFSGKEIIEQNKPQTKNSMFDKAIERMFKGLTKEFVVASYDTNTLVFGSLARVRETFESKTRVGADVSDSINRKPNAIVNFSAKLPNGMSGFVKLDNDEFGKTLDSIRHISGAMEVAGGNATVSIAAKTLKAEQAQSLQETLEGLQMVGKALIGGSKGADKQVYARMIENLRLTRNVNEVAFDLQVPQSDINILLGVK